ncbi:MAG TPA: DUF4388 domain-containing protein [Myxococcaceae bacterium]|nr:DUF4388 domain-containing protein [Myxococcaceae bacterium]
MALKGTLKDFGIADILQLIGQQQKTGMLHLRSRDNEVQVGFQDGNIVKAESTTRNKRDLIGNMLVRAGVISQAQLDQALDAQRRTLKRLGDVLVSSGMMTREHFSRMMQLQSTETLYKLFGWKTGTYEFEQGEVDYDPAAGVRIRAESVLMEGFRMVDEWPVIKKTITSYELTFEKARELPPPPEAEPDADADIDGLDDAFAEKTEERHGDFKSVGPNERRVFEQIVPRRDVRRLIELSCLGEFETCKALLNLVNLGYARAIEPSGRGHAVGETSGVFRQAARSGSRVVLTALVLALLVAVATRVDVHAFNLASSPKSFADPAAQRVISRAQISRIEAALSVYEVERGELPERLEALVEVGILADTDVRYPWREKYYYRRTSGGGFVLLPPLR